MNVAKMIVLNILGGGAAGTANSVPAAISATSTIGTTNTGTPGTWSGAPTLTYQWQRLVAAVWTDIGGATTLNRAPVDADFGYALSVLEIPNGVTANAVRSNITNLTQEAPAQALTDLTGNKNMNFSAGVLAGNWSLTNGTYGGDPGASEVDPSGGAGSGAVKIVNTAGAATTPRLRLNATINTYIDIILTVSQRTLGTLSNVDFSSGVGAILSAVGTARTLVRVTATGTTLGIWAAAAPANAVADYAEDNLITPNTELTAPSADQRIAWKFTPPVTPVAGTQYWGIIRSSNFSSGNYLLVLLIYTGTQWDVTLFKVATHTRTATGATATNIGSCNGFRLNANGNLLDLETTANDGASWTPRGSQVNDATYNTATGVNAMWTSDFTPGNIEYGVPI